MATRSRRMTSPLRTTSVPEMEITGLNTGGMGTFSPSPFSTMRKLKHSVQQICLSGNESMRWLLRADHSQEFLFFRTDADSRRTESTESTMPRFGDPEAQVVLPRMKNDIIDVMEACIDGTLDLM